MQYEKLFRTQSVWKSIFSLAVPSVIIILVMILYNMTDMFFVGQLGDTRQVAAGWWVRFFLCQQQWRLC